MHHFFTGDFNGHSQFWWPDCETTAEGREIKNLLSSLSLSQLIYEPTNCVPNNKPSCIDLVITLNSFCRHYITYCKVKFNIPPPTPFERKIWHYHRANTTIFKMPNFPWL